jgi:hypothetical protein
LDHKAALRAALFFKTYFLKEGKKHASEYSGIVPEFFLLCAGRAKLKRKGCRREDY